MTKSRKSCRKCDTAFKREAVKLREPAGPPAWALEIDPTSPEAHTSFAYASTHFLWGWGDAEREFAIAISLDPSYSHAHHWHSHFLMARGRVAESLAASQRALELDPVGVIINVHLAWHYWVARQYDECAEQC
jgi:tetratricopeptide (TPR) repeat protein